ncbi:MAG: ZIP family metal transporter [Bacteroidia bacterium]|nr:ZIP family metal transporter [Bacteroidia bacterium]NND26239.1 ZIP family metal transporter [Flavobacteriaceae bacterium]MBT8279117.1 ZIP family metal transporter [Bacteroidia bacterium]NNK61059.1 ZIP family metal transporter [Flavobacteriaceae bacterium]NNL33292.1 ZIP family metal transporter [Flavobacteriaceae bacterium]
MNKYLFPIYAVILGFVIVKLSRNKPLKNVKLLLAFSGAFLLSLTVFDLLPEVYEHLEGKLTGLFIMLGIFIQIILEFFSKGAEHGHVHIHKHSKVFPWLLFISLCIHAFLEGFPIHQHNDMVYGVLIHKIPIAILITSYLFQSDFKEYQIFIFLTIFGLMTPLGTIISNNVEMVSEYTDYINAIVIGIFLHISTTILFESSEGHKFNLNKMIGIVIAVAIAYFI